jgi:hypothetical protein
MKPLKLLLYRFFSTPLGKSILKVMSFGVTINLKGTKEKKYPFLVAVTVDTESGYVDEDERRIWQRENPWAFEGYYFGIRNLKRLFDRQGIKSTFFLSTNCFSSVGDDYKNIKKELRRLEIGGHEIGLHLHPDSDFALQKKLFKEFSATSAFFYSFAEKLRIIKAARKLVREHLGVNVDRNLVSFRWGNWALDSGGAKALDRLKFKVDSSATPGIKGHHSDGMKYDWSKVKRHYPWKLSTTNYQSTSHDNSNIMEIPIATFSFFGFTLRADPVNSVLLNKAFFEYYEKADRSENPFIFVIITHSSEATKSDGTSTRALDDLDKFISLAKKYKDVRFTTLKQAYETIS